MPGPPKKTQGLSPNKLRIIGGQWRGRLLSFAEAEGLRPTGNRIRETLFNWLQPVLPGANCLDAFAGSGALGFEALSRGAHHCTLVETNARALSVLKQNAQLLNTTQAEIIAGSVTAYLAGQAKHPYDVVFLDPPFALELWQPVMAQLEQGWLASEAFIYVETPVSMALTVPGHWRLHREKQAGAVNYSLFIREVDEAL